MNQGLDSPASTGTRVELDLSLEIRFGIRMLYGFFSSLFEAEDCPDLKSRSTFRKKKLCLPFYISGASLITPFS